MAVKFEVLVLGTSGARPTTYRRQSAHIVATETKFYLVDCGEGTQRQLMRYKVNMNRITAIFITHLHADHWLGILGLLLTMNMDKRTEKLHLFAPFGLSEMISMCFKLSGVVLGYELDFHPTQSQCFETIFEDDNVKVASFPLDHTLPCTGFLFEEQPRPRNIIRENLPKGINYDYIKALKRGEDIEIEGVTYFAEELTLPPKPKRKFAYCSDTAYTESILEYIQKVDLLYHEASFTNEHQEKAFHKKHATAQEAALIAQKAEVGMLLLGHFSAKYQDTKQHLAEAQSIFENTLIAEEGAIFPIFLP